MDEFLEIIKEQVGKINTFAFCSYVAVAKEVEQKALEGLNKNRTELTVDKNLFVI